MGLCPKGIAITWCFMFSSGNAMVKFQNNMQKIWTYPVIDIFQLPRTLGFVRCTTP